MLGNEMRNNVELVVTSQELVVEGEPFMLDKDQTENLQVESQSMGKDGSKVQGKVVGNDNCSKNKTLQMGNENCKENVTV